MAQRKYDYHVIYNEAFTKRSETDDTKLSEQFTKYLVDKFKPGKVGYFSKTDKVPGENVFKVLAVLVKNTDKTIVVVTPGFLQNCWKTFCHQSAFKSLIDTDKCEKLIPIALCLTEEEMKSLEELNIKEWVDFDANYMIQNEDNENKWKLIGRALDCTDSLETLRRYDRRPHINAQEFFSDKLILELAEHFPSDWYKVCIDLGLKKTNVDQIKTNYSKDCVEQALNGIKCALDAKGNDEELKYNLLKDVLTKLGRVDRAQWLEGKYREYMERNGPPNVGENVTGKSLPLDTYDGASQVNQISASPGLRQSNVKEPWTKPGSTEDSRDRQHASKDDVLNNCAEDTVSEDKIEETKVKQVYGNQPSISKDIDLSIDALRSSDDQEEHTSSIASALHNAEMLDFKSLQQDSVTSDSGLSSMANTPSSRGQPIEEQLNDAIGRSDLSSCQFDGTPHNEENVTPTVTSQTASMQSVVPPEDAVAQNVNNQTNSVSLNQQTGRDEVQSSFQFFISLVGSLITRPEYAYN